MTSSNLDRLLESHYTTDSLMSKLKSVAFKILHENPGSEFGDWQQSLVDEYAEEVTDALGDDPEEVYAALADLWESDYEDPATGLCMDFEEWARAFATDEAVKIYQELVEERAKI